MFGYIKPYQPELRVKELEAYKAVYCGLCGQLGRSFGPLARLTLSYDFTFLSMLYWAVNDEKPQAARRRCYANPAKKVLACAAGEGLQLSADIAVIMIYYKLLDNIHDSGLFSKIIWSAPRPVVGHAKQKAAAARPGQAALVAQSMQRQQQLEQDGSRSLDEACEPTAAALGGIFRGLSEQDNQQRVLGRLGYLIGRYVYLCDALDDLERDVRAGGYNVLALRHGVTAAGAGRSAALGEAADSLYMTIGEAEKTLALLTLNDFIPIIQNIVSMGLRAGVDEILSKKESVR